MIPWSLWLAYGAAMFTFGVIGTFLWKRLTEDDYD